MLVQMIEGNGAGLLCARNAAGNVQSCVISKNAGSQVEFEGCCPFRAPMPTVCPMSVWLVGQLLLTTCCMGVTTVAGWQTVEWP